MKEEKPTTNSRSQLLEGGWNVRELPCPPEHTIIEKNEAGKNLIWYNSKGIVEYYSEKEGAIYHHVGFDEPKLYRELKPTTALIDVNGPFSIFELKDAKKFKVFLNGTFVNDEHWIDPVVGLCSNQDKTAYAYVTEHAIRRYTYDGTDWNLDSHLLPINVPIQILSVGKKSVWYMSRQSADGIYALCRNDGTAARISEFRYMHGSDIVFVRDTEPSPHRNEWWRLEDSGGRSIFIPRHSTYFLNHIDHDQCTWTERLQKDGHISVRTASLTKYGRDTQNEFQMHVPLYHEIGKHLRWYGACYPHGAKFADIYAFEDDPREFQMVISRVDPITNKLALPETSPEFRDCRDIRSSADDIRFIATYEDRLVHVRFDWF